MLDAVDAGWFGQPYQGITCVEMQGTLGVALSGAAVNQKVDSLSQGQVKGNSQGSQANLRLKGTYFANGDFRTDLAGDFGTLLYTRRGTRGFLYSKGPDAYTTRVDLPPSDAPTTYMAWFRQTLNRHQGRLHRRPHLPRQPGRRGNRGWPEPFQRLLFNAPTKPWDAKRREQSMAQSLGFWKRGRLEVTVDKTTRMPQRLEFRNDEQGVHTRMDFSYGAGNKLQAVNLTNSSRGFGGPDFFPLGSGTDGLMSHVAGELTGPPGEEDLIRHGPRPGPGPTPPTNSSPSPRRAPPSAAARTWRSSSWWASPPGSSTSSAPASTSAASPSAESK